MNIFPYEILYQKIANEYKSPKSKITEMIKNHEIIHLKKGLYCTTDCSPEEVAMALEPYSYISFQYVLAIFSIIPEAVLNYSLASGLAFGYRDYNTEIGFFAYRSVPFSVMNYGIKLNENSKGVNYLIATPEKAVMDMTYVTPSIRTIKEMLEFLLEDMRMEEYELNQMNLNFIHDIAPLYEKKSIFLLEPALRKIRR